MRRVLDRRHIICNVILAVLFSIACVVGNAYKTNGTIATMSWISLLWFILICAGAFVTTSVFDYLFIHQKEQNEGADHALWHQFVIALVVLLLGWGFYFLALYPGLFAYDIRYQLEQFFANVYTTHHPVIHTLFAGICFKIGMHFADGYEIGMAIYALIQMFLMAFIFAGVYTYLCKIKVSKGLRFFYLLWMGLHPTNGIFAICTTKDTLFSGFFVLLLVVIYQMSQKRENSRAALWGNILGASLFLVASFRNNGLYVVVLLIPFIFIFLKKQRKSSAIGVVLFVGLYCVYLVVVNYGFHAEKGDSREAYSVPMQQVARTVAEHREELTDEEWISIKELFGESGIYNYDARRSDSIKSAFTTEVFNKNKRRYLDLYLSLMKKYPLSYVDGFLELTMGSWYPMDSLPDAETPRYLIELQGIDMVKRQSFLPSVEAVLEDAYVNGRYLNQPLGFLLFYPGIVIWGLLYFISISIKERLRGFGLIWVMCIGLYGTILLGPVALLRYIYPMWISLPLIFVFLRKQFLVKENDLGVRSINI